MSCAAIWRWWWSSTASATMSASECDGHSDAWMAERGYTVLRFTNDDVFANVEGVVSAIRQEAERLRAMRGER
jgi:very-short-patch-repair endonuclease